eukprot:7865251-Pyramimonas_sp.AAC.1
MKASTGVDGLTPFDFERLPPAGIAEMALILEAIEATLTWPVQILLILAKLTPKSDFGRPCDRIGINGRTSMVNDSRRRDPSLEYRADDVLGRC